MAARIKIESFPDKPPSSIKVDDDNYPDETPVKKAPVSMDLDVDENDRDEEDVVIREIDVYLSPEMCKQLYLLQYPLQFLEIAPTTEARIKPRHGMLEIDHPLPNAIERDGKFEMMDRTYQSQTIPVQTHMCIGKMKTDIENNSSLHLVPITHISQMRPSFKHVDDAYEDPRARERKEEEEEAKAAESKPVTFKRKESERAQLARLNSYAYKKQSEESEEWFDLKVQEYHSIHWHSFMKKVVCPNPAQFVLKDGSTDNSYIKSLNYMSSTVTRQSHLAGDDVRSVTSRLTSLMHLGVPMPFSIIRDKFDETNVDDKKLLSALNACCVMVRGNFCLQSKFLNLHELLKPVRTFILLLLEEDGFVVRQRVAAVFEKNRQLSQERLTVLLDMVAKQIKGSAEDKRGWVPKIEDDETFLVSHPKMHREHQDFWGKQKKRFQKQLNVYVRDPLSENE